MRAVFVLLTLGVLLLPLVVADGGESLLGRWSLTEQYYGEGRHNFHGSEDSLEVSFHLEAAKLGGLLAFKGGSTPWPAYPIPAGFAEIQDVKVTASPDLSSARASYRVMPAKGDDTVLLVEERWRLEGETLLCDVQLRFERGGEQRGGFTWHRVYKRAGS